MVVRSQIVVPPKIPPSQWHSRGSNPWLWFWYHLSNRKLCHSISKPIDDEENTLKSFMAFEITPREPIFWVVVGSQILIPLTYPMYLSLLSFYYQWTSWSYIFSSFLDPAILPDCIRQASPASFSKSPKLQKLQNTLYTLNRCGLCLDTNLFSMYDNGRGKNKRLQWFLIKGWVALSKIMGVLCCRNLSRVFSLNSLPLLLWVMRVYIVWVEGIYSMGKG